jgi:hypothetical protein
VIFLDYLSHHAYRGDESFDTHVWMLKTLLGQLTESQTHLDSFLLYVIAASFRKMDARMTNKRFSTPYFNCLQSQTTFTFIKLPKAGNRKRDEPFVGAISFLAKFSTIPNLQLAAEQWLQSQTIEIYNDTTYMEFHQLLCKLLSDFCTSLRELQRLRTKIERGCESDLEVILKALRKVQAFGHYLRMMVNSSALETHLETIAHLLVVDTRKWWAPEPDSEDSDDMDFQRLKPYSMRKGKPLLPWESYRDWLRLMVHYFDAVHALAAYVSLRKCAPGALSITILSPPLPSSKAMLPWTEMLGNDRFFPTLPGESSGKDFVKFLTNRYNKDDLPFMKFDAQSVIKSAANLQLELEKGPLAPPDSLTKIDALAQMVKKHTDSNEHDVTKRILEEILALKDVQPEGQPAALQAILEMLRNLSKRISFYNSLKQGSLRFGTGFPGNHHCEAYLASLLTLLVYSEESASDSETLDILSKHPQEMELLLFQIKASLVFMHCLNLY